MFAGSDNGSIMQFSEKGPYKKPVQLVEKCHPDQTNITSICCNKKHQLVSRCLDGTMKVWDLRKFTKPLAVFSDLETIYDHCDVVCSPDERFFATGTFRSCPDGATFTLMPCRTCFAFVV